MFKTKLFVKTTRLIKFNMLKRHADSLTLNNLSDHQTSIEMKIYIVVSNTMIVKSYELL